MAQKIKHGIIILRWLETVPIDHGKSNEWNTLIIFGFITTKGTDLQSLEINF